MDHSSTFRILPPRLISTTGIWRRQVTDIVVIVHFSPFLSFFFFSPPSSSTLSLYPSFPPPHTPPPPPSPPFSPSYLNSQFPSSLTPHPSTTISSLPSTT